jgi:hypothetical protein
MTSKNKRSSRANLALVSEPTTALPSPGPFSPSETEGAERRPEIYLMFDGTGDFERDEFRRRVMFLNNPDDVDVVADKAMSPSRRRMTEDRKIRKFAAKTQHD